MDSNHTEIVEALRKAGAGVLSLAAVGDGVPDLLVHFRGATGLLEVKDGSKSPSRRKRTDDQIKFWEAWKGGPMAICTDVESALRFLWLLGGAKEGAPADLTAA